MQTTAETLGAPPFAAGPPRVQAIDGPYSGIFQPQPAATVRSCEERQRAQSARRAVLEHELLEHTP